MDKRRQLLMLDCPTGDLRAFQSEAGRVRFFLDFGSDAPPPDNNPGMIANAAATEAVAKIQQETAAEYLKFSKEQYADMKPFAEKIAAAQIATSEKQTAIADRNDARAQEYSDYEKNTYRPLEKSIVDSAQNYDTDAKREQLAAQGIADVASAADRQRRAVTDQMAQYGINPNSNRFAFINAQLGQEEGAARAGAANKARTDAEQLGYARKLDAASLGRNLSSNASTAYGIATTAGNSSVNSGSAGIGTMSAPGAALSSSYGQTSNMYGNAANAYGSAGNQYNNMQRNAMDAYKTQTASDNAVWGAIGQIGGMAAAAKFADGGSPKRGIHVGAGSVRGPGGPVDDLVPAMLSSDEYVLPADTTKAIGKKRLDKLVKRTHTPAAQQRRQGINSRSA